MEKKSNKAWLQYTLVTIYFVLMLVCAFFLFTLPRSILMESGITDLSVLNSPKQSVLITYSLLAAEFVVSLLLIITFLKRKDLEKIIYVERHESNINKRETEEEKLSLLEAEMNKRVLVLREEVLNMRAGTKEKLSLILNRVCKELGACVGTIFLTEEEGDIRFLNFQVGYAFQIPDSKKIRYEFGEGLAGQVAKEAKPLKVSNVPSGYINVFSGLGNSTPTHMLIHPMKSSSGKVIGVIEVASFASFNPLTEKLLESVSLLISTTVLESK